MTPTPIEACADCGTGTLRPSTWNAEIRHGDATLALHGLECYRCDACGADPVFTEQIRRNQLRIADAKRDHDGMLTGSEVRAAREQMGLTQAQASEVFGGGANAFSKYERGDVSQSAPMDRLLKVAMFLPAALDFLIIEAGLDASEFDPNYRGSERASLVVSRRPISQVSKKTKLVVVGSAQWSERAA